MTRRRAQSSAFTLMELILVMLIICIVLAMAAPSLSGFWGAQATRNVIADVLSLTQWARAASVNEGTIYRLNVYSAARTYYLSKLNDDGQFVPLGNSLGTVFSFPESTQLTLTRKDDSADSFIEFFPTGRLDPATIRIVDRRGEVTIIDSPSPTEPFQVINQEQPR